MKIISPSMLSADFGNLARETQMVERSAAQWIHIDVMDGLFVPNISFGFPVLKSIKSHTSKFIDTHLMISKPERYVERFVSAGSDLVTVHIEATDNIGHCFCLIRGAGAKVGVSIKPATPVSAIEQLLPEVDLVLVMSVEPGFGGQKFMPIALEKIAELKAMRGQMGLDFFIEVDGGVSAANASTLWSAGCDVLVAGSSIFGAPDPMKEINNMLQ